MGNELELAKWIAGLLSSAIAALSIAIVSMWRTHLKRSRDCETEKTAIQERWRLDVLRREEKHKSEYKNLIRESVKALQK